MNQVITGFQDTINWYDANAKKYAQNIENLPNLDLIKKFTQKLHQGARVLDAGCAAGRDCAIFKKMGLKPIGVDISKGLIKVAREKSPDVKFELADFLNLPFENETFDGVWALASLLHLETTQAIEQALQEFNRVLKKQGIIFVFVKQKLGKEKTAVVSDKLSNHARFFQYFTKSEIENLLEKNGFTIQTIKDNYKDPAGRKQIKWIYSFAQKI